MYIVVIGAGAAGSYVASLLSREKQDIVVIEQDEEAAEKVRRQLDVAVVVGNAAVPKVLWQAEVQRADLVVAVTGVDETNMIACFMAKEIGAKKTVARVRNPEYHTGYLQVGATSPNAPRKVVRSKGLGVDWFVNPEIEAAREIARSLSGLYVTHIDEFAGGLVQLREFKTVSPAVVGKALGQIPFPKPCMVALIARGSVEILAPAPTEKVEQGDRLHLLAARKDMDQLGALFEVPHGAPRSVVIFGAGTIGFHVAEALEKRGVPVKLIEKSAARAQEVSAKLKRAVVVQGGGPDRELLSDEGVANADTFIAATGDEALNILAGLVAKDLGALKNIVLVDKPEYIPLAEAVGVDVAMSPLLLCGEKIAYYVVHGGAVTVALLGKEDAQVIEFLVSPNAAMNGHTIAEIDWPKGATVGAVIRGDSVAVPNDDMPVQPGDHVVVVSRLSAIPLVERIFKSL
ncbi:MAG: Trk system potassium transporter TrkA [Dehalococcoidia bacterium]|nr:Trk system potassium transporter TrkA [Dehalococcoidia bacterium]